VIIEQPLFLAPLPLAVLVRPEHIAARNQARIQAANPPNTSAGVGVPSYIWAAAPVLFVG